MTSFLPKDYWTTDHGKELLYTVECNDEIALKTLLDSNRSRIKKAIYMSSMTYLLKLAIDQGNSGIVSVLLLHKVPVNLPIYPYKQTALLYAAKTRHEKIIMDIFHRTTDCRTVDSKGRTALHLLIENEEIEKSDKKQWQKVGIRTQSFIIEMCKHFLSKGMKVNVKNKISETSLFLAVKHEMRRVAEYLIAECDASVDVCNSRCESLLHLLVKNEFDAHEKYDSNVKILKRTRHENVKFMDSLLSKGLKADCKNYNGETALQLAFQKNIMHFLPSLLKYTKNINFSVRRNETLLHTILSRNNKKNDAYSLSAKGESWSINDSNSVVEILLKKKASVDAVDSMGRTPLHLALEQKRYKIVLRMLKRFTNVRACNERGDTVLHIAIQNYVDEYCSKLGLYKNTYINMKIIRTLSSKNADPTIKNNTCMAPIHIAAENHLIGILEMFKKHRVDFSVLTGNGENILELMCKKNVKSDSFSLKSVKKLLVNHEWDVNAKTKDGLTLLHLAAISRNIVMLRFLIDSGADVNAQHKKTLLTPLHLASVVGVEWNLKSLKSTVQSLQLPSKDFHNVSDDVIWKLVRSGADVNAQDARGRTALHLATYRRSRIIRTLLDLGAWIDVQDNNGRRPLQNVLDSDNLEGLKILIDFGVDINDIGVDPPFSYCTNSTYEIQDHVLEHLAKLRAVDLPFEKVYELLLHENEMLWQKYYVECWGEVERLKLFFIEDGVSLYDVLHMSSIRRYYYYTKNTKLMNLSFKLEFPMYHNILKASKREALVRKSILESAKQALCKLINYDLPDICTEHILSYLKISTWTVIVTVLQSKSDEKCYQ